MQSDDNASVELPPEQLRPTLKAEFHRVAAALGLDSAVAHGMEVGVFNKAIVFAVGRNITRNWGEPIFRRLYIENARHVLLNVQPDSYVGNTCLVERLCSHEFEPVALAAMDPEHMCPVAWKPHRQALARQDEKALNPKVVPETDRFKCRKCKQSKCSFYEMQIRSGDEASTLFIMCLVCFYSWRING